jgi:hypothetical protein
MANRIEDINSMLSRSPRERAGTSSPEVDAVMGAAARKQGDARGGAEKDKRPVKDRPLRAEFLRGTLGAYCSPVM